MKIRDLPASSMPRERFLKHGPEVLSDAELFAILLRTGTKGENVIEVSNRLISRFGLADLFNCSLKELSEIRGIGPNKAMQILAIGELMKRHDEAQNPIKQIKSAEDVFKFFYKKLGDKKQEHFMLLLLDNKNNIQKEEFLTRGVLDASIIDSREIFKPAIKNSIAKIILVHNHPSGDPSPSSEDLAVTEKIVQAGEVLGIKVLDHVIIGNGRWWSWIENK